jgi:hypothetical protein
MEMGWGLNRFLVLVAVFLAGGVVMLELRPAAIVSLPPAQTFDNRPAEAIPESWARFAQLVEDQFKARLEANDGTANRFRLFLKGEATSGGDPSSSTLVVEVWVGADGIVERVAFPPLQDRQAETDLHSILEGRNIGPPPSDMPQPLRLKLALDGRNGA